MLLGERSEDAFETLDGLLDAYGRCFRAVGRSFRAYRRAFGAIRRVGVVAGVRGGDDERKRYEGCADEMAGA